MASLLLHGRFIRRHLEWARVRGNHYLSDIAGLLAVAALFSRGPEGREWAAFAARELVGELRHQVRGDGCDHEASIPYHRLVAELFICGLDAAEALVPGTVGPDERGRREAMLDFTAGYTRLDGLAPQVGDADDGRYLPLGDYGRSDPRSHLHLFEQAGAHYEPATGHAAYPQGGYWVMRRDELYLLVRCGDVGVGGLGSHAHNDALSFELAWGEQPLVIDPGSYLYTADPRERNRFRSTAFHSTLQVDGREQNPLLTDRLFTMDDRRRAQAIAWEPEVPAFTGRHQGFAPATHTRRVELVSAERAVRITDTVSSPGSHELEWTFPLAPSQADAEAGRASARFPGGVTLILEAPELEFRVEDGWFSPSYGRRTPTKFIRARKRGRPGEDVTEIVLRIRP